MPRRSGLFLMILALSVLGGWAANAQTSAAYPIAALRDGDVWLYGLDGSSQQLTVVLGEDRYGDLAWSPDGRLLAFSGAIQARGAGISLLLSNLTGAPSVQLATGLHPLLPISFSPDSRAVVYALPVASDATGDTVEVYRYEPAAGAAAAYLGSFRVETACDSPGNQIPSAAEYARETGARGTPRYTMALTGFGLVYSANCRQPNLQLLNPDTGESTQLLARVDGVFVAPDRSRAVATSGATLTFIQTPQGPYTQITTADQPDQVGFGVGTEIYYSTRRIAGETPLPDGVRPILENIYFQMPLNYEVTIHRFSLRTGRDELLYSAQAYGISRLAASADGTTLIFSQVPNPDAWVQAVANGLIAPDAVDAARPYAATGIYALSLSDGTIERIGQGWELFTLNPAADVSPEPAAVFSPVPPTLTPIPLPPTATLPPTLTPFPEGFVPPTSEPNGFNIGAQMVVNPQSGALNVRDRPGTGSPVVQLIYAGHRVTILGGPQDDLEGFRWWQVRLENDVEGWLAERVNGVLTLIPAS